MGARRKKSRKKRGPWQRFKAGQPMFRIPRVKTPPGAFNDDVLFGGRRSKKRDDVLEFP